MEDVKLGYNEQAILTKVHLNLVPGSRIGLLGKNGAGKSTLIKLMSGALSPLAGEYLTSAGLHIGYFAQHQVDALDMQATPFDHIQRLDLKMTEQAVRDYLGGFGFHGDEAIAVVAPMSGGEKARLVLAILVFQEPNLLLLDEPTNHLDIEMRQALNFALQSFEGAIVLVSHDRYLLASVCDDYYLVDGGQVSSFSGDLEDYRKWMLESASVAKSTESTRITSQAQASSTGGGVDRRVLKRLEAEFRQQTKAYRDEVKQQEAKMAELTEQKREIETQMSEPSLYEAENKTKLTQLITRQGHINSALEEAELLWLDAQEHLEHAQADFDKRVDDISHV
jgi:ATP-binding cassette subfamily F protein 3